MNIRYHIHKSLLLVAIQESIESSPHPYALCLWDPVKYYTAIYTWVSQVASFLQVCWQTFVFTFHVHHTCGMFCPYHPLLFKCHISWKVQIVNLLIMKSHHHLVTSFLLGEDNLCNDLFLYNPNLCSPLRVRDRTSHPCRQSANLHSYVCWWMEYYMCCSL